MSTPAVIICVLIALILLLVICRVIKYKRKESLIREARAAHDTAYEAVQEMKAGEERLSAKADDLGERVERLIALLELTSDSPREPSEAEDSTRRSSRRRHGE